MLSQILNVLKKQTYIKKNYLLLRKTEYENSSGLPYRFSEGPTCFTYVFSDVVCTPGFSCLNRNQ